jgi:hypothetical protein
MTAIFIGCCIINLVRLRMKFNKYIWSLFCQSEEGKKAFARDRSTISDFVDMRILNISIDDYYKDGYPNGSFCVDVVKLVKNHVSKKRLTSIDEATNYYEKDLLKKGIEIKTVDKKKRLRKIYHFGEDCSNWYDYVASVSLGLHLAHPKYFMPYNYRCKFHYVTQICEEFGIPIPTIPAKNKKLERALYYNSINKAFQEFRLIHEMNPAELNVFLYDFAPQFIVGNDAADLPLPSKTWISVGGTWDFEDLDKSTPKSISRWSGNANMRRGDIVMMYCVAPRSYIHSIWRACSDGFYDPFFHYHGTVWICNPIKIKPVTYQEMSKNPIISQNKHIKAHLQGSSGKPLTAEEYEEVLKILYSKNQKLKNLPTIPKIKKIAQIDLNGERDVERYLIEPFLKRLGYSARDWIRQMPVRMGRAERNYPDYVLGGKAKRGEESGKMVIETKYQISSQKELEEAYYQGKSYAFRLQTKVLVLAAKEGVWIFKLENRQFSIRKAIHKNWNELQHRDHFHVVKLIMGKSEI